MPSRGHRISGRNWTESCNYTGLPQEDTSSCWNSLSMVSCLLSLGEAVLLLMEYLVQVSEIVGNGSFCWCTVCLQVSVLELAAFAGAWRAHRKVAHAGGRLHGLPHHALPLLLPKEEEEELPFQVIGGLGADGEALGSCFPPRNGACRVNA
ncbi:UNVERIFIED_CONTAM: hypothetical protein FKN15_042679 [Acipenser sinensis]